MQELLMKAVNAFRDGAPVDKLFFAPDIPEKKLDAVHKVHGDRCSSDDVYVLLDDTLFGGAKEGMVVSLSGLYSNQKGIDNDFRPWPFIKSIEQDGKKINVNGELFFEAYMASEVNVGLLFTLVNFILKNNDAEENEGAPEKELSVEDRLCACLQEPKIFTGAQGNFFKQLPNEIAPYYRENWEEGAALFAQTAKQLLNIALTFPPKSYLAKYELPQELGNALRGNEYVTFEIIIFIIYQAQKSLRTKISRENADNIVSISFTAPILTLYIEKNLEDSVPLERLNALKLAGKYKELIQETGVFDSLQHRQKWYSGNEEASIDLFYSFLCNSLLYTGNNYYLDPSDEGIIEKNEQVKEIKTAVNMLLVDTLAEKITNMLNEWCENLNKIVGKEYLEMIRKFDY